MDKRTQSDQIKEENIKNKYKSHQIPGNTLFLGVVATNSFR